MNLSAANKVICSLLVCCVACYWLVDAVNAFDLANGFASDTSGNMLLRVLVMLCRSHQKWNVRAKSVGNWV